MTKGKRVGGRRITKDFYKTERGWRGLVKFEPDGGIYLTRFCKSEKAAKKAVQEYLDGLAHASAEDQ